MKCRLKVLRACISSGPKDGRTRSLTALDLTVLTRMTREPFTYGLSVLIHGQIMEIKNTRSQRRNMHPDRAAGAGEAWDRHLSRLLAASLNAVASAKAKALGKNQLRWFGLTLHSLNVALRCQRDIHDHSSLILVTLTLQKNSGRRRLLKRIWRLLRSRSSPKRNAFRGHRVRVYA